MSSWRGSVFGRVAALLIGAQVLVALLAVAECLLCPDAKPGAGRFGHPAPARRPG
ncbi:hypothetical protein [Rhodothermus marinus]|uniref:hypothetical protein n=1 Tax=Rhodothermus marinus TaxID=29549 RepID=UPI000AA5924B|nr:hypothetical protein [Rhodothermus marinus]